MYQINQSTNGLIELKAKRISELGFKEREHRQEWLKTHIVLLEKAFKAPIKELR
jgi:hypothetical protein